MGSLKKLLIKLGAPLLGTVVGGPAGAVIGEMIAAKFGVDPEQPDALEKAIQADPDAAVKLKKIESNHQVELERLAVRRAANELAADTAQMQEVNQTFREELKNPSKFKSGWRPAFGWVVVITWLIQMIAISYVIFTDVEKAATLITAMVGLSFMWSMALGVLGVNIKKRSDDKQLLAGHPPVAGFLGSIVQKLRGR